MQPLRPIKRPCFVNFHPFLFDRLPSKGVGLKKIASLVFQQPNKNSHTTLWRHRHITQGTIAGTTSNFAHWDHAHRIPHPRKPQKTYFHLRKKAQTLEFLWRHGHIPQGAIAGTTSTFAHWDHAHRVPHPRKPQKTYFQSHNSSIAPTDLKKPVVPGHFDHWLSQKPGNTIRIRISIKRSRYHLKPSPHAKFQFPRPLPDRVTGGDIGRRTSDREKKAKE